MDWIEVPIPASLASGPIAQILHYLEVDESWSVYVVEIDTEDPSSAMMMGPNGPVSGQARWIVILNGNEVATGTLKKASSAKQVAMTVLESLMNGPKPETVENSSGFVVPPGRGSGN